jgi:crotonobetaine/carnitine-CoA ligase
MMCDAAEITENDCFYNPLPLFHSSGQHMSTTAALMAGARMVLVEKFSVSKFWEDVWRYRCTEFTYIGSILGMLFSSEPRPDDADNPLRVLMGAGAPKAIFEAFEERFGVRIVETYGQSEIGLPLNCTMRERKPGSCGKVPRDFVAKVVDINGEEVGPGTPGELLMRNLEPYTVMLEYYGMPDKTVEAWRDLWLHTGDYLYYDADGYFFFADRKKDALRRRGENISSYEVEMVVNSHPAILESAAVAAKSPIGDDEVMVCLVLKPGLALIPSDLLAFCEDRMAYFMVPRYVRFMDALPKTATQRVEKYRLREEGVTPDTWDRESIGYKLKR